MKRDVIIQCLKICAEPNACEECFYRGKPECDKMLLQDAVKVLEADVEMKIEARAVKIAARIMHRAGLCRYEDATKCRKVLLPSERDCIGCIKRFLIEKAKKELEREEQENDERKGTEKAD